MLLCFIILCFSIYLLRVPFLSLLQQRDLLLLLPSFLLATLCIFSFLRCLFSEQFLFCLYVNSPSDPLPCSIIQMILYIRQVLYFTELLAQDILPPLKFEVSNYNKTIKVSILLRVIFYFV